MYLVSAVGAPLGRVVNHVPFQCLCERGVSKSNSMSQVVLEAKHAAATLCKQVMFVSDGSRLLLILRQRRAVPSPERVVSGRRV